MLRYTVALQEVSWRQNTYNINGQQTQCVAWRRAGHHYARLLRERLVT